MPFKWLKGYGTHQPREVLASSISRKFNMTETIALLKLHGYNCEEAEVLEYLKEYPITKQELLWTKKVKKCQDKLDKAMREKYFWPMQPKR